MSSRHRRTAPPAAESAEATLDRLFHSSRKRASKRSRRQPIRETPAAMGELFGGTGRVSHKRGIAAVESRLDNVLGRAKSPYRGSGRLK